jgi:hypothetical protein
VPCEEFVEHHPKRVNIGRRSHEGTFATGLLGSHVTRCADKETAVGEGLAAFDRLGKTESVILGTT